MKKTLSATIGLLFAVICLLQLAACKKDIRVNPPITFPNYRLHGFEIKDMLNPNKVDSNFSFTAADSSLYSITDLLTSGEMVFSYNNKERQSNSLYQYIYNNGLLTTIVLQPGQYGRDSLLLYPNGAIRIYKKATSVSSQGLTEYMTYTYSYLPTAFTGLIGNPNNPAPPNGTPFTVPNILYGPDENPTTIVGKSDLNDNAGSPLIRYTDSLEIIGVDPLAQGPYMLTAFCGNANVHFLNLRLLSDIPITARDGISRINRFSFSNLRLYGTTQAMKTTTDNFDYTRDSQLRPTSIIKNGIPVYSIIYHD